MPWIAYLGLVVGTLLLLIGLARLVAFVLSRLLTAFDHRDDNLMDLADSLRDD